MAEQPDIAQTFITLGLLLLIGLGAQWLGQKTAIPRVTLLLALGLLAGPTGFDLVADVASQTFPWVSHITLAMVGFLLGGRLHKNFLSKHGKSVFVSSIWITLFTWIVVALACGFYTGDWPLALMVGAIATATDPAATRDVVVESGMKNAFSQRLLGIVSLDDIWGLLIFSLSLSAAGFLLSAGSSSALHSLWELIGAIVLGVAMGGPVAWLTGRSSKGEPQLIEALGAVILCAGLAAALNVSYLLACIVMGAVVVNVARHHKRPFHAIEQIEWPFMMLFFILAGASLDIDKVTELGWLGPVYVIARVAGRLVGGAFCARHERNWSAGLNLGAALLPQAGVAIGIALIGSQAFPQYANSLLATAIVGTVLFELLGPQLTRIALLKSSKAPE